MDILQYDNKHVRVTINNGSAYEGIVTHNSASYDEHEFGRDEEGLQMPALLIYADDILSVESLEEREDGLWGKFTEPFGRLEEESLFDPDSGPVLACEILDCEEPEHVIRMLRCIEYYLDPAKGKTIPGKESIIEQLRVLVKYSGGSEIADFAAKLIHPLEEREN